MTPRAPTLRVGTVLGIAAALIAPGLALAAGDVPGAAPVDGMPQLAFGHPEQGRLLIANVVWLFLIFGLLYFVMANHALPRVESVLAERRARIDGDLETALAAKQRADAAMAEHAAATAKARAETAASIADAVKKVEMEMIARDDESNARVAAQIKAADERIAAARDAAMGALRQVAADAAEAMVARLAGGADRPSVERAVDAALSARRAS